MKSKSVEFEEYTATVRRSSLRDSLVMRDLISTDVSDPYLAQAVNTYAVVASVTEIEGEDAPMSIERYGDLPSQFADLLIDTVEELNPHWFGGVDEKKAPESPPNSTSG